jgi:acid-sensing ion channel, other
LKGEKELDYYKIYTAKNCKTECLIKFILKSCGCVPLYHIYERYKTRLCQVKERKCFEDATTEFFEKLEPSCDCLQPCVQLNYEIELKQTKFVT